MDRDKAIVKTSSNSSKKFDSAKVLIFFFDPIKDSKQNLHIDFMVQNIGKFSRM